MNISRKTVVIVSRIKQAEREVERFFREIAEAVNMRDTRGILLPPEIEPADMFIQWQINSDQEDMDFELEELEQLMADGQSWDFGEDDDGAHEEESGGKCPDVPGVEINMGLYVWAPEVRKACISIYAHQEGKRRGERWRLTSWVREVTGGQIHLFSDEWSRDDVEIKRIPLGDVAAGRYTAVDMARNVMEVAGKLWNLRAQA